MTTYILDVETTIQKIGNDFSPSPFNGAKIVCLGVKPLSKPSHIFYPPATQFQSSHPACLLVGHNIKFDLLHLKNQGWKNNKALVWDTQLAEYLLSGQQVRTSSLDNLCVKYHLPSKDPQVTEYFDKGLGADHVPRALLEEYLKHDLEVTEAIYLRQLEQGTLLGMLPLIHSQMDALLALVDIEYNGMTVDRKALEDYNEELSQERITVESLLFETIANTPGFRSGNVVLNLNSRQQIATFLYGGTFSYTTTEVVTTEEGKIVEYKTGPRKGTPKTKKVEHTEKWPGGLPEKYKKNVLYTPSGEIKMDEDTLSKLEEIPFVAKLLKYYSLNKDISTYSGPYMKYVNNSMDGKIHPQYNQSVTVTGRLSCSQPNLQNVSNVDEH